MRRFVGDHCCLSFGRRGYDPAVRAQKYLFGQEKGTGTVVGQASRNRCLQKLRKQEYKIASGNNRTNVFGTKSD